MPALTDPSEINALQVSLGSADAQLQAQLVTIGPTLAAHLKLARTQVYTDATDADIDDNRTLVDAFRKVEKMLSGDLGDILTLVCKALNVYSNRQNGTSLRLAYKDTMAAGSNYWTDAFRALWRRVMNEELVVRVGYATRASGSWVTTPTERLWGLETALEVRIPAGVTLTQNIDITLTLLHTGEDTETVDITLQAGWTSANKVTVLTASGKAAGLSGISAAGGTGTTDQFEVWIKP